MLRPGAEQSVIKQLEALHGRSAEDDFFALMVSGAEGRRVHAIRGKRLLADACVAAVREGYECWLSVGTFAQGWHETASGRRQFRYRDNCQGAGVFFVDIDVGEKGQYASQQQAASALFSALSSARLPHPLLTSSGGGLHAVFELNQFLLPSRWRELSRRLVLTLRGAGLLFDEQCTTDICRSVRLVGSVNRKNSKRVGVLSWGQGRADVDELAGRLLPLPAKNDNDRRGSGKKTEWRGQKREQSAETIAAECQQVAGMGAADYHTWHACLSVLAVCHDGHEVARALSKGGRGWSVRGFELKWREVLATTKGPALCTNLERFCPGGCAGCVHAGRIKTPAQLGYL